MQLQSLVQMDGRALLSLLRQSFEIQGDPNTDNIDIFKMRVAIWCGCELHPEEFERYYKNQYQAGISPSLDEMRSLAMKDGLAGDTVVHRLLVSGEADDGTIQELSND